MTMVEIWDIGSLHYIEIVKLIKITQIDEIRLKMMIMISSISIKT